MNVATSLIGAAKFALTPVNNIARKNERMLSTAILCPDHITEIDRVLSKLLPGQMVYKEVAKDVNPLMPWWIVCLEHAMEAGSYDRPFNYHLHCGDPLSARTFHIPKGRPLFNPGHGKVLPSLKNPYTWGESAVDALLLAKYDKETDFSIGNILYEFEKYNGTGYMKYHPDVPSPYIWSFTSLYTKGKYVQDGKWNKDAVSAQPGCAAYLLRMKEQAVISF